MTKDRLIAPNYPLNPKKADWFGGPKILTEDLETIRLYGSAEFTYSETDQGITVLNNRIVRKPAIELLKHGLFEYVLIGDAPRITTLIAVLSHEDSGLLLAADINIREEATYPSPRSKVTGSNMTWTEGEDPKPLHWFESDQSQKLSEYRLSILRSGS